MTEMRFDGLPQGIKEGDKVTLSDGRGGLVEYWVTNVDKGLVCDTEPPKKNHLPENVRHLNRAQRRAATRRRRG